MSASLVIRLNLLPLLSALPLTPPEPPLLPKSSPFPPDLAPQLNSPRTLPLVLTPPTLKKISCLLLDTQTKVEVLFRHSHSPGAEAAVSRRRATCLRFPGLCFRLQPSNHSTQPTSRTNGSTTQRLPWPTTCSPTAWALEALPLAPIRSRLNTGSSMGKPSTGMFLSIYLSIYISD